MTTTRTSRDRATNDGSRATDDNGRSGSPDYSAAAQRLREAPTYPVPHIAKGPAVGPDGYVMQEVGDKVFWLGDGSYQSMYVVADDGVIAVDAPPTLGDDILRAIAKVTPKPVAGVVYSHEHSDPSVPC